MWQTITGAIEVLDDAVRIEIDLPWMMRLLGETVIESRCTGAVSPCLKSHRVAPRSARATRGGGLRFAYPPYGPTMLRTDNAR